MKRPALVVLLVFVTFVTFLMVAVSHEVNEYMETTTAEERQHDSDMREVLKTLQRGDFVEMEDGSLYLVRLARYNVDVLLLNTNLNEVVWEISTLRFVARNTQRVIRHDDPEAETIWEQMRPMPEEKVAEREASSSQ